jgi:hypothetical protein
MGHGPEQHIEHAEHAAHAAHDNFNKQVTMSIAIVAAVLACVTMLGHRAHNETLLKQGEALALQTIASKQSTDTANKWAYYQSKNIFNLESEITVDLLAVVAIREDKKKEFERIQKKYANNVAEYKGTGFPKDEKKKAEMSEDEKKKAEGKLKGIKKQADDMGDETTKLLEKAEAVMKESHIVHAKAARVDYGELGLQFGVVLCSLAILTKSRGFWFAGLLSSLIGAIVAGSGFFVGLIEHSTH